MSLIALLELYQAVEPYLPAIFTTLALTASVLTSYHVLLTRREPGSSIAWMALVWLAPLVGVAVYLMLGINRIRRRAKSLGSIHSPSAEPDLVDPIVPEDIADEACDHAGHLAPLVGLVDEVVDRPLLPGARLTPLFDGDEAYPAMLEAIDGATKSITLVSYIFDNDETGRRFVRSLEAATHRGVEVRVLIDAAGLRYTFPSIMGRLKRAKIPCARFLPSIIPPHIMTMNLRSHRKIMVVDGRTGFTGGINIRRHHVLNDHPPHPTRDLHFKVEGPVVAHLQEVFCDDWQFTTSEELKGPDYFPPLPPVGTSLARGITDGPDEDLDKLRLTIKGAIASAHHSIRIATPYFIPDPPMVAMLNVAALRGVLVDIILPQSNNLPFVHWASMAHLGPLLERGCRIHFTPPPFDHSKLMVVDRSWILCGSANIDPRSLRLNFEFNVECWDCELASRLDEFLQSRIDEARELSLDDHEGRSRFFKLRDSTAALLSPYL